MKFFIFILIILTSLSFKSYNKKNGDLISEFLKNELEEFEISKEKKNISNFFNENKISNLEKFFDIKNSLAKEMNLYGVPTSFFINKEGDLIGYYHGDMEWDNDTVINFINYLIKI